MEILPRMNDLKYISIETRERQIEWLKLQIKISRGYERKDAGEYNNPRAQLKD